MLTSRRRFALTAALLATAAAVVASAMWSRTHEPIPGEFWPAFEATVVEESLQDDGTVRRLVHRLDYDGRTDWVLTTLEDSDNPRMNGMVRRVSDGEHTISRPEFPVQAFPLEENELLSPGYWLALWDTVPEFERSTRADGDTELSRSESVDCTRESCPQSVGPMAEFRQLVVVNEERIPLLVDETLGSVVLYRMTLDDLTITEQ